MSREIEAKFTISDLVTFNRVKGLHELAGFTLADGEDHAVKDVYLDTASRSLLAAGWALRRREGGSRVLVTAKRLASTPGPVQEREELEIALGSFVPPRQWPDCELREIVLAMVDDEPFFVLFEVSQHRVVRNLSVGARVAAEMSLDQVRIVAGGRKREYLELEIELRPEGSRDELSAMVAALGEISLVPSPRSKFEEGLALLDGAGQPPHPRRPVRAKAALSARLVRLQAGPQTTPEAVHVELGRLGYRFRARARRQETRLYFDTQGGSLFRQDAELYFSLPEARWHLLRKDRQEGTQKGRAEILPETGPVAESVRSLTGSPPRVPCLEATLRETALTLSSLSAPRLGLTTRAWELHSPLHDAPPQTALTLILDPQGATAIEVDYLAGLLSTSLRLQTTNGPDLQFCLARLGVPLPGAPIPEDFVPAKGDDVAAMCSKILGGEAWRMKANTPGAVRDLDPEFVHDLRVATRRARFACRLFGGVMGPERHDAIRAELSWIAGLLGSVRDLDVLGTRLLSQLSLIEADEAFRDAVIGTLEARRARAREVLIPALGSARYASLLALMSRFLQTPAGDAEAQGGNAEEFGRRRIGRALGKIAPWLQRDPEEMSLPELHRLRILFKRLRYTAEFFRTTLGEKAALIAKECVAYQDCLGALQDARVAVDVLSGLADESALRERAYGLLSLGALVQVQRDIMRTQREKLGVLCGSAEGLFDLWSGRVPETTL